VATSQWTPGKNFWRTGAFGPWMVSADEIAPNQQMSLVTRLSGQEMQRRQHRHDDPQHPAPDRLHLGLHSAAAR
jgi:2-keto-4-pentenoate hydratase/2-oxohepta-3-ene-1,7-dioic acid hydratase in catechol pathway